MKEKTGKLPIATTEKTGETKEGAVIRLLQVIETWGAFATKWIEHTFQYPKASSDEKATYFHVSQIIEGSKITGKEPLSWAKALKDLMDSFNLPEGMKDIWLNGSTQDYTIWNRIQYAYTHGYIDGIPKTLEFSDPYYKQFFDWWKGVIASGDWNIIKDYQTWLAQKYPNDWETLEKFDLTVSPILDEKASPTMRNIVPSQPTGRGWTTDQLGFWIKQYASNWTYEAIQAHLKSLGYTDAQIREAIENSGRKIETVDQKLDDIKAGPYGRDPETGEARTAGEWYATVYQEMRGQLSMKEIREKAAKTIRT